MPLCGQVSPGEKPYWIIVSNEGPSTHPKQHTTFEEAQAESIRLAKLHPGLEFGVFKYVGKTTATPTTTKVTKWAAWYNNCGNGFPVLNEDYGKKRGPSEYEAALYDSREEALRAADLFTRPIGAFPFEIEVPAEQKIKTATHGLPGAVR